MRKLTSTILVLGTLVAVTSLAVPSHAGNCTGGKLGAAGKKAGSKLTCHQKAAKKGETTDSVCLTRAEDKLDSSFIKWEAKSPCFALGDAPAIEAKVDAFIGTIVADLRPVATASKCAAGQLKVTGKKARAKLTCHQKAANKGFFVDPECLTRAETAFDDRFATAVSEGDCLSASTAASIEAAVDAFVDDVVDDLRPGPHSKCTGTKAREAADKTSTKLKCHAAATKAGIAVDSACLTEAETKFSAGFATAETFADCLMPTGDAAAIEAKVDAFVSDVESALRPVSTASKCSSSKLTATGKETHKKLDCRGKAVRFGLPPSSGCTDSSDVNGFTKPESGADCLTTGDAAAIEALIDAFVVDTYDDLIGPPGPTTTTTTTTTSTVPPPKPPCGILLGSPACDGFCTTLGDMCSDSGGGCMCAGPAPAPCGLFAPAPLCLGDCPPFMACVDMAGVCVCMP